MRQLTSRQRRAAIALAVVAVLFASLDVAGARFDGARGGVQGFLGALYRGSEPVVGPARRWVQALPHLGSDESTIAGLRRQVADLQRQQAVDRADRAALAAVARLQLQATRGGYRVVPARVSAIGPDGGFDWTVALDAGAADGVRVGQSVIAGAAVVGRVVRVSTSSATVLLAADPQSGIGARDQGSGEIGTVRGAGTAGFTYTPLDAAARPRRGATLVTGPAGSTTYVPGLTIGTVTSIGTDPSGLAVARVVPAAKASTLDVVGVIRLGGQSRPRPAIIPRPASVPGAQARPR